MLELDLRDSIKLPKVFLWCTGIYRGTYLLYNLFKKINKHMFMLHAPFCRSSNRTWHTETNYLMFIQKALHENFTSIKQAIMERPGIACALGKIWLQVRWQNVPTTKCPSAQCVLCKVYFSAQPNKLRPILKFKKYCLCCSKGIWWSQSLW